MKKIKMLTPERVALLVLSIAIITWALIMIVKRYDHQEVPPKPITDTIIIQNTEVKNAEKELIKLEKKNNKKKKSNKQKKNATPIKQRDHLNEPIEEE